MLTESPKIRLAEVLPRQVGVFEVGWCDPRLRIVDIERQLDEYLDVALELQAMKVNISHLWSSRFESRLEELPGNEDGIGANRELELEVRDSLPLGGW